MSDVQQTSDTSPESGEVRRGAHRTRRGLIVGAGALGASALLAACGTDSNGTGTTASGNAGTGDAAATPSSAGASAGAGNGSAALATTSEVPVGGGVIKSNLVVTQPTAGVFRAFSRKCTHLGCPVSEVKATINCNCHNSTFSISDGSVTGGPAKAPLPEVKVKVDGENIVPA